MEGVAGHLYTRTTLRRRGDEGETMRSRISKAGAQGPGGKARKQGLEIQQRQRRIPARGPGGGRSKEMRLSGEGGRTPS